MQSLKEERNRRNAKMQVIKKIPRLLIVGRSAETERSVQKMHKNY